MSGRTARRLLGSLVIVALLVTAYLMRSSIFWSGALAGFAAVQALITFGFFKRRNSQVGGEPISFDQAAGDYRVVLLSHDFRSRLKTLKVIVDSMGVTMGEAGNLMEHTPSVLVTGATQPNAEEFVSRLREAGATAELERAGGGSNAVE